MVSDGAVKYIPPLSTCRRTDSGASVTMLDATSLRRWQPSPRRWKMSGVTVMLWGTSPRGTDSLANSLSPLWMAYVTREPSRTNRSGVQPGQSEQRHSQTLAQPARKVGRIMGKLQFPLETHLHLRWFEFETVLPAGRCSDFWEKTFCRRSRWWLQTLWPLLEWQWLCGPRCPCRGWSKQLPWRKCRDEDTCATGCRST